MLKLDVQVWREMRMRTQTRTLYMYAYLMCQGSSLSCLHVDVAVAPVHKELVLAVRVITFYYALVAVLVARKRT